MEVYYSLRVTILKKFSLIDHPGQIVAKKKRSKFGSNDNSECGLSFILGYLKDSNAAAHSVDTGIS